MDEQKDAIGAEEALREGPAEDAGDIAPAADSVADKPEGQAADEGDQPAEDEAAEQATPAREDEPDAADAADAPAPAGDSAPVGESSPEGEPAAEPATSDAAASASQAQSEPQSKPATGVGDLVVVGILAIILGVLLALPSALGLIGGEEDSSAAGVAGGVAATVNGVVIGEDEVTKYVMDFRAAQGIEDDKAWAEWLMGYGYTPEALRSDTVDYYIDRALLSQAVREQGIEVAESEVDEFLDSIASQFGDQASFEEAIAADGIDLEEYRAQVRSALEQQALIDKVAADSVEVSDEEVLDVVKLYYPDAIDENAETLDGVDKETVAQVRSMLESTAAQQVFTTWLSDYRDAANVVIADMPESLPYAIDLEAYQQAAQDDAGSDEAVEAEDEPSDEAAQDEEGQADEG